MHKAENMAIFKAGINALLGKSSSRWSIWEWCEENEIQKYIL